MVWFGLAKQLNVSVGGGHYAMEEEVLVGLYDLLC